MDELQCLIVDDEPDNRANLRILLEEYCPSVKILAEADGVRTAYQAIQQHQPNLVFLDIEMGDGTGFDLLETFDVIEFQIIFVTAYQRYAIKAIKANALDYLLKPIDILELGKAVQKACKHLQKQQLTTQPPASQALAGKLPLHTSEQLLLVDIDDIVRLEGENNYTRFHLAGTAAHLVSKTLKSFEEKLCPYNFMRVHQSHMVNLQHVKSYYKKEGGYLIMSDNSTVNIARQRKEEVLKRLSFD